MAEPTRPDPFKGLIHSRKFWLLILATVVNLTTLGLTTFATKETQVFAGAVLVALDGIFAFVIKAVTDEDVALIKHDAEVSAAEIYAAAQVKSAKVDATAQVDVAKATTAPVVEGVVAEK